MKSREIDVRFPLGGLDRKRAFREQAPFTTSECLNVWPSGQRHQRDRGGSRPGLDLAMRDQLPGPIRLLTKISIQDTTEGFAAWTDRFLHSTFEHTAAVWSQDSDRVEVGPNYAFTTSPNENGFLVPQDPTFDPTKTYSLSLKVIPNEFGSLSGDFFLTFGMDNQLDYRQVGRKMTIRLRSGSVQVEDGLPAQTGFDSSGWIQLVVVDGTTLQVWWRDLNLWEEAITVNPNRLGLAFGWLSTDGSEARISEVEWYYTSSVIRNARRERLVAVAGGNLYLEKVLDSWTEVASNVFGADVFPQAADAAGKLYLTNPGTVIEGENATIEGSILTDSTQDFDSRGIDNTYTVNIIRTDTTVDEIQRVRLLTGAGAPYGIPDQVGPGGTFILTHNSLTTTDLQWNSTAAEVQTAIDNAGWKDIICTGIVSNPDHDLPNGRGTGWQFEFRTGRNEQEIICTASLIDYDSTGTPTAVTEVLTQGQDEFEASPLIGRHWKVVAVNGSELTLDFLNQSTSGVEYQLARPLLVYDPVEETVEPMVAEVGTIPVGCELIAFYRDRLTLAAPPTNPGGIFFSRQGEYLDWDMSEDDTGAAIAASIADAHELPSPITAIIPHSDDCMLIGCYSELYMLRGDMGFGGFLDNISRTIGIIDRDAWTHGTDNTLPFLGRDGLYVMPAGCSGVPKQVSRDKLPEELLCLESHIDRVQLAYDLEHRGVHICVTPLQDRTTTHWWFDWDHQSFWRVRYPTGHDPMDMHAHNHFTGKCSTVMFGCRDGFVRNLDRANVSDGRDGIDSMVRMGPFALSASDLHEGILNELVGVLGRGSGTVSANVVVGQSFEDATEESLGFECFWHERLNPTNYPRCRGLAGCVILRSADRVPWTLERVTATIKQGGKLRIRSV